MSCTIAEIPAGSTRRLTVRVKATSAGPLFASGNVNLAGDGDYTNNTANASAWVQAARDVEVTAGPATVDLGVGVVYEIPYVVRSRGPQPTGDVSLVLSLPSSALVVDSIDAGGVVCAPVDPMTWRCDLGALAPGASHGIRLRVRGTRPVNADVHATVEADDDGYTPNNYAGVQLRIDHRIDLAVTMASGGSGVEDAALAGQITLRSLGRHSVVDGTFDIELHAAGELRSATIHAGLACELTSSTAGALRAAGDGAQRAAVRRLHGGVRRAGDLRREVHGHRAGRHGARQRFDDARRCSCGRTTTSPSRATSTCRPSWWDRLARKLSR